MENIKTTWINQILSYTKYKYKLYSIFEVAENKLFYNGGRQFQIEFTIFKIKIDFEGRLHENKSRNIFCKKNKYGQNNRKFKTNKFLMKNTPQTFSDAMYVLLKRSFWNNCI